MVLRVKEVTNSSELGIDVCVCAEGLRHESAWDQARTLSGLSGDGDNKHSRKERTKVRKRYLGTCQV